MNYVVDTHILIGRLVEPARLSAKVKSLFSREEENRFLIPTIVLLEIQYLKEIGKIEVNLDEILLAVGDNPSFKLLAYDEAVMLQSLQLTTNRDPFDRIILAHALSLSSKIITKDRWMKKTAPHLVVS